MMFIEKSAPSKPLDKLFSAMWRKGHTFSATWDFICGLLYRFDLHRERAIQEIQNALLFPPFEVLREIHIS